MAPPEPCQELALAEGPEQVVRFRQTVRVEALDLQLGDEVEQIPGLALGCTAIGWASAALCLDLLYEQRWYYRRSLVGALSATVALAPGETLSVSIRNTQRKQFDRETVDEVERTEQSESTIADKDVLNVTRSSSRTDNWTVNANASVSLPEVGELGLSASVGQTVTDTTNSSAQRTRDSTQKSASNLKTLQKVQIRETTELTTEASTARRITNPYRDRSLRLDVYEVAKEFCVEFHFTGSAPAIVLTIEGLVFDRDFVLTNRAFLSEELIDRPLDFELTDALAATANLELDGAAERAEAMALRALKYLFTGLTVFGFPVPYPPMDTPAGPIPQRPPGWDENDPATSFVTPFDSFSGLTDATENGVGVVLTTLGVFHRLYVDEIAPTSDGPLAVEAALALEAALAPRWIGAEETDKMSNVLDAVKSTEVLRRLAGFLTMAGGMLRPLVAPAEEERENRRAAERAEFVIGRAVAHLRCHTRHYTERFLAHLAEMTSIRSVQALVEEVLAERLDGGSTDLREIFDAERAFLDGTHVVVPIRVPVTAADVNRLLRLVDADRHVDVAPGLRTAQVVVIPVDGAHLEPAAGHCVLAEVPDDPPAGPLHVVVQQPQP
ncbi:hypothetical protein ACL02T_26845 [Pseudonocardia sp. RS010]|uniref:hypothetical protein n=1 Tax=Pseudonocardia sp. RS010 TaxID=3385979 RepID=UPI00399EEDE3